MTGGINEFELRVISVMDSDSDSSDTANELATGLTELVRSSTGHIDVLRGIVWRLFLGVLPRSATVADWVETVGKQRQSYEHNKQRCLNDLKKELEKPLLSRDLEPPSNPPSENERGWKKRCELSRQMVESSEQIRMDLTRCFLNGYDDHFLAPHRQEFMFRVLFVWGSMHPDTSYRQGMHELLALLVLTLESELPLHSLSEIPAGFGCRLKCIDGQPKQFSLAQSFRTLLDPHHIEADCFLLFSALMTEVEPLFAPISVGDLGKTPGLVPGMRGSVHAQTVSLSPIIAMCFRIQGERLERTDPELHFHLLSHKVPPQIYMMKWLRLLFCREFDTRDVARLWDSIFLGANQGRPVLEWLELFAVVMIVSIRQQLLENDATGCLQLLLNHPVPMDIVTLVQFTCALERDPFKALDMSSDVMSSCTPRNLNLNCISKNYNSRVLPKHGSRRNFPYGNRSNDVDSFSSRAEISDHGTHNSSSLRDRLIRGVFCFNGGDRFTDEDDKEKRGPTERMIKNFLVGQTPVDAPAERRQDSQTIVSFDEII